MVKRHHIYRTTKLLILSILIFLIWGAIWLQSDEHSLTFAKPWILSALNPKDAPYTIGFDELTIDWRHMTELGSLRITQVTFAKPGGAVFAQLPEAYATVDLLGFLPTRQILHKLTLHSPRLFLTRDVEGVFHVGIEGAEKPVALEDFAASAASEPSGEGKPFTLPFREVAIDRAVLTFHDDKTGWDIESQDLSLTVSRHKGRYGATLLMPFLWEGGAGMASAIVSPNPGREDYRVDLTLKKFPGTLVCMFARCPGEAELGGLIDLTGRIGLTDQGVIGAAWSHITTENATLTAPQWFEKPLLMRSAQATLAQDKAAGTVTLSDTKLALEDTTLQASGIATEKQDGWYVEATGSVTTPLDITKLYKYWPLTMAHDTRSWITSKLKSGYAHGVARFHLTPEDFTAERITDKALDSDVAARDITLEYLPGFPEMHHVDGDVHFTGRTAKIVGHTGTMLEGTKITNAILLCPDLVNPKTPMEVTVDAEMPVKDVVTLLSLKYFTFDDPLGLDAKKASGTANLAMALKFDGFSGKANPNSDEIHLEGVNYDIKAGISDFAQSGILGGYDVRNLSGTLLANLTKTAFDGVVTLGETGVNEVKLSQNSGAPLVAIVKSRGGQTGKPVNDFSLTYQSGEVPHLAIKGKRLDATAPYGTSENNLLKDFPAINLDIDLESLFLAAQFPFTNVKGNLHCTKQRCDSAQMKATVGHGQVTGAISRQNGSRSLVVTASDAGAFLRGLDISDRVTRGKLDLHGTYDDTKTPAPYTSRLLIQDFSLKNSQILGRILSIGSLTGLSNLLTGNGISFDKLAANIVARGGLITISDGQSNGNAMGITFHGTVDTTTTNLGLKGVVVPAYALNSILGHIPLIGALMGGEGEGLIAFNYSVRGTYENPDVRVNPLSGLTPGFLRGIFRIFDAPTSKPEEAAKPGETPGKATETPKKLEFPGDERRP